jgi:hypothetical protein
MARVVDGAVVVLAELERTIVVEPTTSSAEVAAATGVSALVEVSTPIEVPASAVISTSLEVSAAAEVSTATTRGVSRDTSTYRCAVLAPRNLMDAMYSPFEDTPAPISMSGSSITMPPSSGLPPVPPCSAVNAHLRSASVSRAIGTTLMPVW